MAKLKITSIRYVKSTAKEKEEINKILREIKEKKIEGEFVLSPKSSLLTRFKYSLCEEIISFQKITKMTGEELGKIMGVDRHRVSNILNYHVFSFTLAKLIECLFNLKGRVPATDKAIQKITDGFLSKAA